MLQKRTLLTTIAVIVALVVIAGIGLWLTAPQRTLNGFLSAVEAKDATKAMSYVSDTLKANKRNNVEFFVDDWATGGTVVAEVTSDEAWRSRPVYETDASGNKVVKKNKYGYDKQEIIPTPRYWAHHYHAFVAVTFDDFEDPVVVKLIRDSKATWTPLGQLFRGWRVSQIKYQPLSDEDYVEIDAEDLFGDDVEVDEDGNIILDEADLDILLGEDADDSEEESDEGESADEDDAEGESDADDDSEAEDSDDTSDDDGTEDDEAAEDAV